MQLTVEAMLRMGLSYRLTVVGKNIRTTANGFKGQFDRLYGGGKEFILREYNANTSRFSKGQGEGLEAGPSETIARGDNALKAGLKPGRTLSLPA